MTAEAAGILAQQSVAWTAKNILAEIGGGTRAPFHYFDKGIMAMIGRNAAVAAIAKKRHELDGPIAFAAWLRVHCSADDWG
jgi:NADH dehydrogenase